MSDINTIVAREHYKDENEYLDRIGFLAFTDDGKNISMLADEEGNTFILLTPKSARWVAEMLKKYAQICEARA